MSATSVCGTIGYHQGHEFLLALEKAGLTGELAQQVISCPGNKKAEAMMSGIVKVDERFVLLNTFNVTVPADYVHATCLATFHEEHGEEFAYFNPALTDENFNRVTIKLVPGRKFQVEVWGIKERVSSDDCLAHLRSRQAVLVSAQGATLVYKQGKDKLPVGKWSVSLGEKDALWKDAGGLHRGPLMDVDSGGSVYFSLGCFERDWHGGNALLCFRDLEA